MEAGLALVESARSDLDALETALVFTARAEGLTWARVAETMGMRSPQAAQQRYQRTAERPVSSATRTRRKVTVMPDGSTAAELMVLQAVRLAGVANLDAILDRAFVASEEVDRILTEANAATRVEQFAFGDSSGWIITEAGSARLKALLSDEVGGHDATSVLVATLEAFEPLNEQFVGLVSRWQLQSTLSTTTGFGTAGTSEINELLISLSSMGSDLREKLAELIQTLPRFGRYSAQYATAVDRAKQDGLRWVTGVGLLSCHVVWAELHQDLLSSLGRNRLDDRPDG